MAAGFQLTAADINNQSGRLVVATWKALDDVRQWKIWLDDSIHNDAFLIAAGLSQGDADMIQAAFTDLDGLRKLSHATTGGLGVANVGSTAALSDFFYNAKNLSGAQNVTV